MRRVLVTFVLALTGLAMSLATAQSTQTAPAQPDQSQPTSSKVIKDPAEYNAYMTALNTQDPAQRAAAMEAFVNQYPNSIVKPEALDQALAGYQAAGNQAKLQEIANKVLQINPNSVRALAILTYFERASGDPAKAVKARQDGEKGLQELANWTPPADLPAADAKKMKDQMTAIFAGAAGFGALQAKDYAAAKDFYKKAVEIDPNSLQDIYQLGIASLESNPMDPLGFWYIAKAVNLSKGNDAAVKQINGYGQSKYKKYHGGVDGWDQIVTAAAAQTAPPADFAIKPAPTPAELACKVVQDNDPATLSASDWEYVLQYRDAGPQCNKDAAEKVWQAIQAKQKDDKGEPVKIKLPGVKVIAAAADALDVALTEENQQANKPDIHVVMEKPLTKLPAVGSMTDVIGLFSSYTPNPFMFTMDKGDLPAPPKPKAPVHHPATKKK